MARTDARNVVATVDDFGMTEAPRRAADAIPPCDCGRPIVRIRRYHAGIVEDASVDLFGVEWRLSKTGTWELRSLHRDRPGSFTLSGSGTHYHLHCGRWRDVGGQSRHERKAWTVDALLPPRAG